MGDRQVNFNFGMEYYAFLHIEYPPQLISGAQTVPHIPAIWRDGSLWITVSIFGGSRGTRPATWAPYQPPPPCQRCLKSGWKLGPSG